MRHNTHLIAVAALLLTGCFSGSSSTPTDIESPQSSTSTESIFPHKSGWKEPGQHGIYVKDFLEYDTSSCTTCHDADGAANTTQGGAPGCRSCHTVFPHTDSGVTFETHGQYVMKNGKSACATQCHGVDLKGGLNDVACTKCHTDYPHESGWSTPSVHGPLAKGNLKLNCVLCHGNDYNGGTSTVSCVNCHKGSYPHPDGWATPDQHGVFVLKNGTGKCATQCHGVQLDGGLSGVNCNTCHTVWPHPNTGWLGQHGETARTIGLSGCMGCHQNDATGGTTGVSCTQCHTALPAHQDADFLNGGHGKLVMQQPAALTDPKGCSLCHGAKLDGGKLPTSPTLKAVKGCNDSSCHTTYPQLHKTAVGAPAWNTYLGHATWILNQVDSGKGDVLNQINTLLTECKLCHGNDLTGGTSGKSCYSCHPTFPHNIGDSTPAWLSKHGASASTENPKAASCATANCHGQKLDGSSFNGKKLVGACTDCHLQMPHQAAWPKTHGASAATNIGACTTCHGTDLKGKGSSPSCYQCHNNFPFPHRNADGTQNTQWKPAIGTDFHGALVMAASGATAKDKATTLKCTTCHDSGNAGNPSPTCYSCHASFPHAAKPVTVAGITYSFQNASWGDFTNGHGQYVVARAKLSAISISQQIQKECATSCHGTDLLGGTSKKSCTTCHASYPHTAEWVKAYDPADTKTPGGAHGLHVLKTGLAGCLTGCHGTDGSGGNSGKACTTCHNYPHKAGWKDDHTTNAEYPPHALSVINTNNTAADKNDDTFNATAFDECAKCHGAAVDYYANKWNSVYPLPDSAMEITLEPGITVKRCTSCHLYPHQKATTWSGELKNWALTHASTTLWWPITPPDTCGSVEGKAGCHTTGPTQPKLNMSSEPACSLCHTPSP